MIKLKIYFPKQKKDYKAASRTVRRNRVFKPLVIDKDDRELTLSFENESQRDILMGLLDKVLTSMGYIFEVKG